MSRILIESSKIKNIVQNEIILNKSLVSMVQNVDSVRNGLRNKVSSYEQIAEKLKDVSRQIAREADAVRTLCGCLEQIVEVYGTTESGNGANLSYRDRHNDANGRRIPLNESIDDKRKSQGEKFWGIGLDVPEEWWERIHDLLSNWGPFSPLMLAFSHGYAEGKVEYPHEAKIDIKRIIENYVSKDEDSKNRDKFQWKKDIGKQRKYYKDLKTGKIVTVDPEDDAAVKEFKEHNKGKIPVDIKLAGVGLSGNASLFHMGNESDAETFEWSASALQVKGNAEAYIGAGMIGASMGVGVTAFTAEEKAMLGTEDLNVYEKVKVDAGKYDANGEISVGIVDKNGKLNPNLYASASAEALAFEASGEVGLDTPYGDIGVEGKVNFGIGAHANVGLHDGKLSVDIGATLGVGASVKIDLDLSETIDTVVKIADNVSDAVSDTIDFVAEKAGDIWSGVTNFFKW